VTALFTDIGACAAVHALDKDPCGRDLERELARGAATIPAVFISGKLVGSTNEIVIKAIGNNEERKEITARRHKILTWKTLSNKER
jgi:glutaredoxin 3